MKKKAKKLTKKKPAKKKRTGRRGGTRKQVSAGGKQKPLKVVFPGAQYGGTDGGALLDLRQSTRRVSGVISMEKPEKSVTLTFAVQPAGDIGKRRRPSRGGSVKVDWHPAAVPKVVIPGLRVTDLRPAIVKPIPGYGQVVVDGNDPRRFALDPTGMKPGRYVLKVTL